MSKKTKLSLTQLRQLILPVGKYYNRQSGKLLSVFGVNKNERGARLKPIAKFKNWLKRNASGDDYQTILGEMEQIANAYNNKAEEQGETPDKYYTNQIKSKGLNRNKETKASKMITDKLKSLLEGEAKEEDVKKVQSVNPKDLKQVMEDKKKEAEEEADKPYTKGNKQRPPERKPRKKEMAGSRIAKREKKEREKAKVEKIITGEPDVLDSMAGKGKKEVQKDMSNKLYSSLLNNVKQITKDELEKIENEEKQKVRVVAKEQSSDITDPTSGENSFDNIQLAVTDFKNETGQGIHTDELMRRVRTKQDEMGKMIDKIVTNPKNLSDELQMKTNAKAMLISERPTQPNQTSGGEYDGDNEVTDDDETKEDEPLRGQVQQQGLGGRQGFRRPPQQQAPRRPEEALENTQYGDLTIPQEVERDAGDGRLGISQAPVPQMDIETETISRNKKTIQLLRSECKCFKQIYKDKIKTKRFKTLVNVDLERKSLDEVRLIHKHFTEEVRDYYNSHRGLRVGVIVDPAILGLNVQALQGMIAPRVPSYAPAVDAGRQAEGFSQVGGELRRRPPTGQTPAIADTDVHYKLGGVRHATGKYDRDIESLNNHIDREEDKKKSNFGRGSTRFNQPKNFKNSFYQAPSHTNIPTIRLKTK